MTVVNARELHNETSAILNEVCKGKAFQIVRDGKLVATLQPATDTTPNDWAEIMAEVWAAQKKAVGKTPNPALVERKRRR